MEPDEGVVLMVVSDAPEADVVCGLLRSNGIDCAYRDTEAIDSPLEDFTAAGPREILEHNFSRQALDHDNHAVANDLRDNAFKRIAFLRRPWTERASAPPLGSLVRVDAAFERTTIPLSLVELAKTIFNRHRRSALRRTR